MKPSNFRNRALTAVVFLLLMIGSILLGASYFAILMLVVFNLGLSEFYRLFVPLCSTKARYGGYIAGSLLFSLIFSFNAGWLPAQWLWASSLLLFIPFFTAMFDNHSQSIKAIGITLAGFVFLAIPLSLLSSLIIIGNRFSTLTEGLFLLMILIILWVYDTAAYIFGSWAGKHKLYERLSPGKTWEGSIAGLIFGFLTAIAISLLFPEIHFLHWLAIALIIMVFGTLGDLCESMLKRNAGVKDSGKILPGHGGILDRFDAVLFTAPAIYLYMVLFF